MDKQEQLKLNEQLDDLKKQQAQEEKQEDEYYQILHRQSALIMDSLYSLGANGDLEMRKLSEYMSNQDFELKRLLREISDNSEDYFQDKRRQLQNKLEE